MTKQEIRALANQARHALRKEERIAKSHQVVESLKSLPSVQSANVIFSYRAMEDEINLMEFDHWCREQGKRVAYPVCGKQGLMDAYVPNTMEDFEVDRFGIASPVVADSSQVSPSEVDVILVPCVAFDEQLGRCGHGAGFYDRYMAKTDATRILVAFDAQKVPQCVMDEYDLPMDLLVTESQIYRS